MQIYNYNISPFNIDRLTKEIKDSTIAVVLDNITSLGNSVDIIFRAELSNVDQTLLNEIVENHSGEALPEETLVAEVKIVEDLIPKDTDGSPLNRVKITKSGWHYQLHSIEFSTSKRAVDHSKHVNGSDIDFCVMKCYDENDSEITEDTNLTSAVKTVITWEATHDIDLIGAMFYQATIPSVDIRMWTIGVPDVPVEYGGSKPFVTGGLNLKFLNANKALGVDGRAPKTLTYSATYHTNKFAMIFKHPAGTIHPMMVVFELFKA